MIRLVLASASPARTATLTSAGIVHTIHVSDVDEPAVLAAQAETATTAGEPAPTPADQVLALACAKAEDVAAQLGGSNGDGTAGAFTERSTTAQPGPGADRTLVLGCDSMLEADLGDGVEVVGKPGDAETAARRWRAVRGSRGVLHTGHWLVEPDSVGVGGVSSALIHFADLADDEIEAYVATGEPLKVAGGFTVDGLGGPFIEGIEGDHHGVVGVSLPLLRDLLAEQGVGVTELWR